MKDHVITSLIFAESLSSNSMRSLMFSRALVNFFFCTSKSTASFSLPIRTLVAALFLRFSAASVNHTSLTLALFAMIRKHKSCYRNGVQSSRWYSMHISTMYSYPQPQTVKSHPLIIHLHQVHPSMTARSKT